MWLVGCAPFVKPPAGCRGGGTAAANHNTVLVAMGTGAYIPLALNLRASVARLGPDLLRSFCFVALDAPTLEAFRESFQLIA